jgi:LssY C-terminus
VYSSQTRSMLSDRATLLFAIGTFIFAPAPVHAEIVSAGTRLEVRLSVPTGSRISHSGDHIQATVIAPVFTEGQLLIPQGAIVSGVVESVQRLGLGLKHLTSGIEYRFDSLQLTGGTAIPIEARVVRVETAKEIVNAHGMISGIHPTANLSSTVAFYTLPLLYLNPEVSASIWGIKFVVARSPDPEIYLPPGSELILQLTAPADVPATAVAPQGLAPLSAADIVDVHRIIAKLPPQQTGEGHNIPSDLVNILFLGSRESINRAFHAAGWSGAQRTSIKSIYRIYQSMVQRIGYTMAPMENLMLNGAPNDAGYQKNLDTFSKRHHVRLWKQEEEDAWLCTATEDIGYRLRRMHLTHAIDPLIDNERAKVLNDLAYTGCLDAATLMTRDSSNSTVQRERFSSTDGKIAVVRINACLQPRQMPAGSAEFHLGKRTRAVQALVALRDDLIRTNPISLALNTTRLLRAHRDPQIKRFIFTGRKTDSSENRTQSKWTRPSVLDTNGQ